MKKIILIVLLSSLSFALRAQDPMYSHTFMTPVYLNPAATGMADYDFRMSAAFRRQWLIVPSGMQYFTIAADKYIYAHNIGTGVLVNSEREGFINKTGAYGTFSKLICFGSSQLNLGIQGGAYTRRVDYSKLWFADQINNEGIVTNLPSQVSPNINNKKWLPDFAAGALWVHNSGLMLGGSVHHLNQPDESFTSSEESKLPRRLTITARKSVLYLFENEDIYPVFGAVYSLQRKNQMLSLGVEVKTYYFNFGLWYRNNLNFRRSDAISLTVTFDNFLGRRDDYSRNKLRTGFAYDFTTNGAGITRTAGSSEAALLWEHSYNVDGAAENRCNSMGRNGISCPPDFIRRTF